MNKKLRFIYIHLALVFIYSQDNNQDYKNNGYKMTPDRYVTTIDGSVQLKVNIWGHIKSPGVYIISNGDDLASMLSIAGGPMNGANLKDIRLYREIADKDGKIVYKINLEEFIRTGDRSNFVTLNPNDTIIIPQKITSILYEKIKTVDTFFTLLILFNQILIMVSN
ncbi:MAG: polysaccharide biosynthesis/export family protein [Candidatus Neomarinimicrobiota bacterium]